MMTFSRFLVPSAAVALTLALLTFVGVRSYGGNVSALLHMDAAFGQRTQVPPGIVLYEDGGYDGMAYYQIARDLPSLFTDHELSFGSAYRFQRILVPFLVLLFSFGQEAWFPWTFLLLNVAAAIGSFVYALRIGRIFSVHALAAVFNPAMLVGMLYSLTEPVSLFFLMMFFWLWKKEDRLRPAAVAVLTLSLFARETTVFLLFFLFLWFCFKRRWSHAFLTTVPVAAFILWQGFLSWRFGQLGMETGGAMFNVPFSGIVALFGMAWRETGLHQLYRFSSLSLLAFVFPLSVLLAKAWLQERARIGVHAFLLTGLLAVMFSMDAHIWGVITSIGRVVTPVYPAYVVYAMKKDTQALRLLSWLLVCVSVASAFGIASVVHPFTIS